MNKWQLTLNIIQVITLGGLLVSTILNLKTLVLLRKEFEWTKRPYVGVDGEKSILDKEKKGVVLSIRNVGNLPANKVTIYWKTMGNQFAKVPGECTILPGLSLGSQVIWQPPEQDTVPLNVKITYTGMDTTSGKEYTSEYDFMCNFKIGKFMFLNANCQ